MSGFNFDDTAAIIPTGGGKLYLGAGAAKPLDPEHKSFKGWDGHYALLLFNDDTTCATKEGMEKGSVVDVVVNLKSIIISPKGEIIEPGWRETEVSGASLFWPVKNKVESGGTQLIGKLVHTKNKRGQHTTALVELTPAELKSVKALTQSTAFPSPDDMPKPSVGEFVDGPIEDCPF